MKHEEMVEAIKAEIDRLLLEKDHGFEDGEAEYGYNTCLKDMRRFLSTLKESEKPVNQDELEKEINRFREIFRNECDARIVGEIANHFAQWGVAHTHLSEDAVLFSMDGEKGMRLASKELFPEARKIYLWGYEDGKKQMMEEAIDADVNTYEEIGTGRSWAEFVVEMPTKNLGDKVRIIVLPKED